mmetsp:Transcript_22934/g.60512  ORF Transcript_22934/g.60512 Transcript_22934/m.60512 type:complete len:485 (+) Transcript_22934:993-2447(+)
MRLRETRAQLEGEAEAARKDDREEIRQLHAAMDHELRVARNAADDRFEAFRKQHAKELAELEAVHRRAEAKLTSEALLERDAWENKTRSRLTGQRSVGDGKEGADADDAAYDVAGGVSATGLAPRLTDFERAQAAAEVEREEAQMRADRDSEIEGFIRTLQTRSMARAVELREKFAADDQKYSSEHAVKCQELRESKADWHSRHVETQQAQQRLRERQRDARQKLRQLQSQSRHMADLASDISSALTMATVDHALDGTADLDDGRNGTKSAEFGSNGASGHVGVVRGAAGSSREQARAHESEISSAMAQLDELEAECRRQREAEAEAVKSRQDEHSRTLHALNDSVRVSVAERQDEVVALEDALEAEVGPGPVPGIRIAVSCACVLKWSQTFSIGLFGHILTLTRILTLTFTHPNPIHHPASAWRQAGGYDRRVRDEYDGERHDRRQQHGCERASGEGKPRTRARRPGWGRRRGDGRGQGCRGD